MPEIFWRALNPTAGDTNAAVDGDIFINSGSPPFLQRRKVGAGWVFIVPPEDGQPRTTTSDTRGDVAPAGGQLNERLAKIGNRPWEMGWVPAAGGVIGPPEETSPTGVFGRHEQTVPELEWEVTHNLSSTLVNVTVIDADGDTILVPRVQYVNEMQCLLYFVEPVAGTAIVRR